MRLGVGLRCQIPQRLGRFLLFDSVVFHLSPLSSSGWVPPRAGAFWQDSLTQMQHSGADVSQAAHKHHGMWWHLSPMCSTEISGVPDVEEKEKKLQERVSGLLLLLCWWVFNVSLPQSWVGGLSYFWLCLSVLIVTHQYQISPGGRAGNRRVQTLNIKPAVHKPSHG